MIRLYKGKTKFIYLPWTIGQTVTKGGLVAIASGQLVPAIAGTAGAAIVGVVPKAVTSTSTHEGGVVVYTTQGNVAVEVPVDDWNNVVWECDVDTTHALVLLDIGTFMDLSSESGYTNNTVDAAETTEDVFQCVGFISATKGLFVLNIGLGADTETSLGA